MLPRKALCGLLIGAFAMMQASARQVPSHAAANLALGALNFDNTLVSSDPGPINMLEPYAVVVDPASGKVFVSDPGFNRVLRFASASSLKTGDPAELAFGQPDLTSDDGDLPAPGSLIAPAGIAVDSRGRLWVADSSHNRVVMYENAATITTSGPNATLVLGQPDLTTGSPDTKRNRMNQPGGLCIDTAGRLWVADSGNNRVLRFDNAATKVNGADADGVLGQQNFDTSDPGIRNQQLNDPSGVTVDAMGTLWVADRINDRIFGYPSAATISNGTNAARVLGQPDFNTTTGGLTASKVDGPWAVFADNANNLWVVDGNNMRVLRYANLSSIENGKPASTVIGQADYVSNVMATSARNLYNPRGVFVQPDGTLWVADLTNGRALRFATADSEAPIVTINGRRKITTKKTRVIVRGTASDDTGVTQVILRSPTKPAFATGTTVWKRTIRLKKSRTNVSAYAYDATGEVSAPAKVVIIRKARPLL